jgi:predicted RNase H-like HicB family nuclease
MPTPRKPSARASNVKPSRASGRTLTARLLEDPGTGQYTGTIDEVPGVVTQGPSPSETLRRLGSALELVEGSRATSSG